MFKLTSIASLSPIQKEIKYSSFSKNEVAVCDTFITKKNESNSNSKSKYPDIDEVLIKKSRNSLIASIAGIAGFAVVSFLSIFVGTTISLITNMRIRDAIKGRRDVPKEVQSNLYISRIINIIALSIVLLTTLFIVLLFAFVW